MSQSSAIHPPGHPVEASAAGSGRAASDHRQPLPLKLEAGVFWRLRRNICRTVFRQWTRQARLRLTVLALLTIVFWLALFASFTEGFWLLNSAISHEATRIKTIQAVFNVFFLALSAMLTLSSAVVFYSVAFRSEDMRMLMTLPASASRIAMHKLQETAFVSCWGFVLLGSPMLLAYGLAAEAPWYYYLMLPPFILAFVTIPAALGAIVCILLVRYLPRLRVNPMLLAGVAAIFGFVFLSYLVISATSSQDMLTQQWLNRTLARLELAQQRLLPSWWLSSGLLEAAHAGQQHTTNAWRESILFLAVLVSNALMFTMLVGGTARWQYRNAFSRMMGAGSASGAVKQAWVDRVAMALLFPLKHNMRLLILKDLRLCRRDPLQWSQFVVFLGLLALYFLNIRRFHYGDSLSHWMNIIGFLNVAVVGLILSTFTTRFIFPMISLEGRRFWILGSLPLRRDAILWSKLLFACGGAVVPCSLLILFSDIMLGVLPASPVIAAVHQLAIWVLCIGLSAMAVGLGSRLPDLHETSPSKIAAGFGGTLNLVLSAVFIIVVVTVNTVPCYLWLETQSKEFVDISERSAWAAMLGLGTLQGVLLGVGATIILGVVVTYVPMRLGFLSFRKLEF